MVSYECPIVTLALACTVSILNKDILIWYTRKTVAAQMVLQNVCMKLNYHVTTATSHTSEKHAKIRGKEEGTQKEA